MKIELPSIREQQKVIFEKATREGIHQLKENLKAKTLPPQTEVDEALYSRNHLLRECEGWEAPAPEIVRAYFKHFQDHFPEYGTDKKLAALLGLSSDRRVREIKEGSRKAPYGVWRTFLVLTGRAPQEIVPVLAFMG
ncbi:hypothetical protein [Teredinibacter turnerae]|uniref:hypothetical protein n=1 Tax=Teredinibacter turnerae TaxID=2426 RepID=UPI0004766068|nr:hypothetical protein [Teredinibacter turnerae]